MTDNNNDPIKEAAIHAIDNEKRYIQARNEDLKTAISERDKWQQRINKYEAEISVSEQIIKFTKETYVVDV